MNWIREKWNALTSFLSETRAELKKVTFPSRSEVVSTTVVVVAATFVFGFFLWLSDLVILRIYRGIYEIVGG